MKTLRAGAWLLTLGTFLMLSACGGASPQGGNPHVRIADAKMALPPMAGDERAALQGSPNEADAETYEKFTENAYVLTLKEPRSTFSTSVDTAAYSNLRRFITGGKLPPRDAIRIADLLNYFDYDYPRPRGDDPVAFGLELAPCPWNEKHHLLKIAVAARKFDSDDVPPRNLVFLIDTSGSMQPDNRLPLVKRSLKLLVDQLRRQDRVSIVTYAGTAGLLLPATDGDQKDRILGAIENLGSGGSTNGAGGIHIAYEQAKFAFVPGGVNRVILATDGDFNVGVNNEAGLLKLVEEKRKTGVYLTVLGYGMGNLKDSKLETLAHHGNGYYAYIDTLDEARKVFVDQAGALMTVAKDVKLQVEFNHRQVQAYRLIGYENRVLKNEDFRNDAKDAGDMGSGHTCTALYEIVPVGAKLDFPTDEPLKYLREAKDTSEAKSGEWLTLRMRYKQPDGETANELSVALPEDGLSKKPSGDFQFAAGVVAFGMLLRDSEYKGRSTFPMAKQLAEAGRGKDEKGYRAEFVRIVEQAASLK